MAKSSTNYNILTYRYDEHLVAIIMHSTNLTNAFDQLDRSAYVTL